jgi:hypothetical protein
LPSRPWKFIFAGPNAPARKCELLSTGHGRQLLREDLVQSEAETWPRYWNITERGRSLATGLMSKRTPPPAPKIFMSETLRTQIQEKAGELSKHYLEFAILLKRLSEPEQDESTEHNALIQPLG